MPYIYLNTMTQKKKSAIKKKLVKKKKSAKKNKVLTDKNTLDEIIRVDHAGEYGATRIYDGQIAIFGKNSKIGKKVSIAHLSYVGDADVGNNVNIGAGTITCNYDGNKKHKTVIKDNVFIGSNSSLIAPLILESNSKVGAGSVITKNIPKGSLALERSDLKILRNKRTK